MSQLAGNFFPCANAAAGRLFFVSFHVCHHSWLLLLPRLGAPLRWNRCASVGAVLLDLLPTAGACALLLETITASRCEAALLLGAVKGEPGAAGLTLASVFRLICLSSDVAFINA
jgi:hypothetical protein